jgi:hypothetical protein
MNTCKISDSHGARIKMNLFSENYADYPDDEGRKLL